MSVGPWVLAALTWTVLPVGRAEDSSLVGYWRFNATGPLIRDLSGKGHDARVSGGEFLSEGAKRFLRCDGNTRIEVPSAPELNLRRGFSIEMQVRPTDVSDGRLLVAKLQEYLLRIDWPAESSRLSFFVHLDGAWEPRVSATPLEPDNWAHVVASWDGAQLMLWVNGIPHALQRRGDAPLQTNNPLLIGAPCPLAPGFVGDIEYVRVYARALTPIDVISAALGESEQPRAPISASCFFDFRQGTQGWSGRQGAQVTWAPDGLAITAPSAGSLAVHDHLRVPVDRRDFLVLRMAVDRGGRGAVLFVTTRGAWRIPFATLADRHAHTYVLEPWQFPGWGGELLALGLMPADVPGAIAKIAYVRLAEEPSGEGELRVACLFPQSVLPRANRPERIIVRVRNVGGQTQDVRVSLRPPPGVSLKGSPMRVIRDIGYQEERELSWVTVASSEMVAEFTAELSAASVTSVRHKGTVRFAPGLHATRASYVPEPKPAILGRYRIWTHYCPLWKHGTHIGWKAIEPYPGRKPVLGWYNEGMPEVADWHIRYWLEHGITGVIYCWYRSTKDGPVTQSLGHAIHDGLLKAKYLPYIRFGIMWENGCGKGVASRADLLENVLPFWLDNYFTHPSYLKVDGKPVLYVWVPDNVTRDLGGSDAVRETFDTMREKCRERGLGGLYIVGCVGAANRATIERMAREGWDATSAYGNSWYPPKEVRTVGEFTCAPFEGFVKQQEAIWKAKTEFGLLPDITAAMMGWDSRPWRETSFFWSENTPEKFRDLCLRAKAVMDAKGGNGPEANTIIFCCWNEFGEGHYIEPTREYGFAYLDVIREVFTSDSRPHTDLCPEDVGLGPYDSWYRRGRAQALSAAPFRATSWTGRRLVAWTEMMGLDQVVLDRGVLRGVSVTSDPALSSPPLKIRASRFRRVAVNMRVSKPGGAQLFWSTTSEPQMSEQASAHINTIADGGFHEYIFPVGENARWDGCVTGLRFDPTNLEGVTIELRSIILK